EEGRYTIEAALAAPADCLPVDDRRWLAIDVRPQLRVACVTSRPGAADEVARALSFAQGAIVPEVFPLGRLATLDLATYDALFLAGGAQLAPREVKQLDQYVRAGGALTVLLDGKAGSLEFLPVKRAPPIAEGEYRFDPLEYRHPIVRPFRGREKAGLLSVVVSRYVRMAPEEKAETVLAFDSGDPALVVARHGLGSVAALALPVALSLEQRQPWSSFAVSPSFVPVMRELLTYLVSDRQQQNLLPGQTAVSAWRPAGAIQKIEVRTPSGDSTELFPPSAEDQQQVIFGETDQIGVYSLRAGAKEFARFVVNVDADSDLTDSELSTLDPSALPPGIATSAVTSDIRLAAADFPFSRSLLVGAALLLLFELTFAWLMGRGWT
ncbi:MAG: GldG family protein, partial [Pirellulales bacterium]|nr:GldG family protein [Pirellulales bacterium]